MLTIRTLVGLGAASAVMAGEASGQFLPNPPGRGEAVPGRFFSSAWSVEGALNYSTNFARTADGPYERRFQFDDGSFVTLPVLIPNPDGSFTIGSEVLSDTIDVEPIGKAFTTVTVSGISVLERKFVEGIVQGAVRVGHNLDGDSLNDELQGELNSNLPPELDFFPGADITPTIGAGDAFLQTWVDPNMSGLLRLEVLDDYLALETAGFVTQQNLGGAGSLLNQAAGRDFNQLTVGGFVVSPVSRFDLPGDQKVELRASNSSVYIIDQQDVRDIAGRQIELGRSVNDEASVRYSTGGLFTDVEFQLEGLARRFNEEATETSEEQVFEQLSGNVSAAYAVSPKFRLRALIGYDDATIETIPLAPADGGVADEPRVEDLSGVYYTVGFEVEPTRQSQFSFDIGERYGRLQTVAVVGVSLTPHIRLNANVNRQVSSGLQSLQGETAALNNFGLQLVNQLRQRTESLSQGEIDRLNRGIAGGAAAGGQLGLNIQPLTNIGVTMAGVYPRTDWSLRAQAILIDRDRDETDEEDSVLNRQGNRYNVGFQANRRVTRRLSAGVFARAIYIEANRTSEGAPIRGFGFVEDTIEQFYGLNVDYALGRSWSLTGGVSHQRRDTDAAEVTSLFTGTPFEFTDNQVRIGARYRF